MLRIQFGDMWNEKVVNVYAHLSTAFLVSSSIYFISMSHYGLEILRFWQAKLQEPIAFACRFEYDVKSAFQQLIHVRYVIHFK